MFAISITEEFKADPERVGERLSFELTRPDNVDASVHRDSIGLGTQVIFLGLHSPALEADSEIEPVLEQVSALPEAWQDLSAGEIRSDLRSFG